MEREITLPVSQDEVRSWRVGDTLYLTGQIFTARDEVHQVMLEYQEKGMEIPFDHSEMAVFHCGPVMRKVNGDWEVIAAGPTTSIRMELFEDRFLAAFRTRIIIGKGGMGDQTQAALEDVGAVYAHFTGGAGALAAQAIERVKAVYWLEELGMPEAAWIFQVTSFGPLLVTMDSAGGNLYTDLAKTIVKNQERIDKRIAE